MTKGKKQEVGAKAASRKRNFATVIYPESAPVNWQEILSDAHVAALVSPLHDRDTNPDGEIKKPHRHVLLMFESPKDFENQVKPIFDSIGGVGREVVNSMRGYARYLVHMDNPEKFQYNPADVLQFGGADFSALIHLPSDDVKMLAEVLSFIRENEIYSLAEFLEISQLNHPEWFSFVGLSKGWIVKEYMKSLSWELDSGYVRQADRQKVDVSTGEVISDGE